MLTRVRLFIVRTRAGLVLLVCLYFYNAQRISLIRKVMDWKLVPHRGIKTFHRGRDSNINRGRQNGPSLGINSKVSGVNVHS